MEQVTTSYIYLQKKKKSGKREEPSLPTDQVTAKPLLSKYEIFFCGVLERIVQSKK